MKGFKVWSESGQRFLKINEFAISMEGKIILLRDGCIFDVVESGQEYTLCRGVSKTDIEGNKIYADSSIVEFDFGTISDQKLRGVFEYSNFHLCYFIHLINDKRSRAFKFDVVLMKKLKIIGTLQENKELLNG